MLRGRTGSAKNWSKCFLKMILTSQKKGIGTILAMRGQTGSDIGREQEEGEKKRGREP